MSRIFMIRRRKFNAKERGRLPLLDVKLQRSFADIIRGWSTKFFYGLLDRLEQNPAIPEGLEGVARWGSLLIFLII